MPVDFVAHQDVTHRALQNKIAETLRGRLSCPVYVNNEPLPKDVAAPYVVVGRGRYHVGPSKSAPGQADIVISHHMAKVDDHAQIVDTQAWLKSLSTPTIQQIVLTDTNPVSDSLRIDTFGVHHVNVPVSPTQTEAA
jgi:hypothetical protein